MTKEVREMPNIFVIDDDPGICRMIERVLIKEGYGVKIRNNCSNLRPDEFSKIDLLLLDVMMPGIDGFEFCRKIRKEVDIPILFITAKTMEEDLLEGFSSGGDDYIKKPFSIAELRARVEAHLRREKREKQHSFQRGEYRFDIQAKELFIEQDEEKIILTKSEYDICEFLAKNWGQVFSLERILESIFGYDSESDISSIRVHIKNIRKKLIKFDKKPIETVWGVGYKWKKEE